MAQGDRGGFAAVFAADADLDRRVGATTVGDGEPHQAADALGVDRGERVGVEHPVGEVAEQEAGFGVVPADRHRRLGQVVGAEAEEVGVFGDLVGGEGGPWDLDHRADRDRQLVDVDALLVAYGGDLGLDQVAGGPHLRGVPDEGHHDLGFDHRTFTLRGEHRLGDRSGLHPDQLRDPQSEPHTAQAEHRVRLAQVLDPRQHRPHVGQLVDEGLDLDQVLAVDQPDLEVGGGAEQLVVARQELVQRRVEEADDHGVTGHRPEQADEVVALHREEGVDRLATLGRGGGHDHALHDREPLGVEEHVLGAAQADALGAIGAGPGRLDRVIRVGSHVEATEVVGPAEELLEPRVVEVGGDGVELAGVDRAGRAVDRDPLSFVHHGVTDGEAAGREVDVDLVGADHGRLAELAGDQRGVAGAAAARGEDALRREHAVHVVRLGVGPHEDDPAAFLGPPLGQVGVEGDHAHSGPRRHVQRRGEGGGAGQGAGRELRVEEGVDLGRRDAAHGLLTADQPLVGLVDRDPHGGLRGALAVAGLQHPEGSLLDRELHVLHVAVVVLEPPGDGGEPAGRLGLDLDEFLDRAGRTDAGDHVLALGVDEEVPLHQRFAGGGVAAHRHPGGAVVAAVAEDHRHDVDGGAEIVGDVGRHPVVVGSLAPPALEHGLDRQTELLARVVGERAVAPAGDDRLEPGDHVAQVGRLEVGVVVDAAGGPGLGEHVLEAVVGHAAHDAAEHLHEPAVGIEHETLVARRSDQAVGDLVVEPDVEDRVHHPRHRELGARSARHEERVGGVAEPLLGRRLESGHRRLDLVPQTVGESAARLGVGVAGPGGDREPWRHRHAEPGHVAEVGALAAQQRPHLVPVAPDQLLGLADLVEPVDPALASRDGRFVGRRGSVGRRRGAGGEGVGHRGAPSGQGDGPDGPPERAALSRAKGHPAC